MIDKRIEQFAEEHTSNESPFLYKLNRTTHLRTFYPNMLSGKVQGKFLEMLMYMLRPKRVLEIGTFTGYSALAMAQGMPEDSFLYTIEINEELEDFLHHTFNEAGEGKRIKLLMGDALEIIPELDEVFDFVFIDADKEQYIDYYEAVFRKVVSGGFILADNVLWGGKAVFDTKPPDKETKGIRSFNEHIKNDNRVDKVMLTLRDGLYLIRKL